MQKDVYLCPTKLVLQRRTPHTKRVAPEKMKREYRQNR